MKYNFFEAKFGPDFCKDKLAEVKGLISTSTSFTILGMPGVGVTTFLRYLAITDLADFIYIDSYLLPTLSKKEFFQILLKELGGKPEETDANQLLLKCIDQLKIMTNKSNKIVIILNRFDQLKKDYSRDFFNNIYSLRNVNPSKICIITTSNRPIPQTASNALAATHINIFSRVIYFQPFCQKDIEVMAKTQLTNNLVVDKQAVGLAIKLCAGSQQLLQILLKSARVSNPLQDEFIKIQLKQLYDFLNYQDRKTVQKIALEKVPTKVDDYLIKIGMVNKTSNGYKLFSSLFENYLKETIPFKLPAKEAILFKLLKKNLGKLISKEEIFDVLWPEDSKDYDKASEWALNSLIYRLRKNPSFIKNGYIIENYKKEGYILVKS